MSPPFGGRIVRLRDNLTHLKSLDSPCRRSTVVTVLLLEDHHLDAQESTSVRYRQRSIRSLRGSSICLPH